MARTNNRRLGLYVKSVSAVGFITFAALILSRRDYVASALRREPWVAISFLTLAVVAELLPIRISNKGEQEDVTTSTTFAFALLLTIGPGAAAIGMCLASIIGDTVSRKSLTKTIFNAAQFTVSLAASGLLLMALSDAPRPDVQPHFLPQDLPGIVLAALCFFLFNHILTGTVIALSLEEPVVAHLTKEASFQFTTGASLLALAPVIVIAANFSPFMMPLLALPMGAIYRAARQAVVNEYQALHDALTGLPNRILLRDRLQQAIMAAAREQTQVGILILDLDGFKEVNDTLGHHNGDILLREVAGRVKGVVRESDTFARLGGDEFALLLPLIEDPTACIAVADKIGESLEEPIVLEGLALTVSASTGIAVFPAHGDDVDTLIQRADVAMYLAKGAKTGWAMYAEERDQNHMRKLEIISGLRRAIDDGELMLYFQPKAELATGKVFGVEALLRWNHPRFGMIPPNEFISIAEHTGLIKPVTSFVINEALRQCQIWRREGFDVSVAVNLSVRNLLDLHLPEEIFHLLIRWEIPASSLLIEITESDVMADPERCGRVLKILSDMGIRLSIDDFGTGYSSLAYLRRLPVSELKIDRSFVMNMDKNENDAIIVRSTIEMARSLGLECVAEGVENQQVHETLRELGCAYVQGFHLSKPLPASQMTGFLSSRAVGSIGSDSLTGLE